MAVVTAVVALLVLSGGGDSGEDDAELVVERAKDPQTGADELLVSAEGSAAFDRGVATSGGAVGLVCVDGAGQATVTGRHPWPFLADALLRVPHVHQPASPQQVAATVRCRLTGTRFPIEGRIAR